MSAQQGNAAAGVPIEVIPYEEPINNNYPVRGLSISSNKGIGVGYDKYDRRESGEAWDHNRRGAGFQRFYIKYGNNKYFNFALLPAIESNLSRGVGGVPEVKPGLVSLTSVKYKTFLVPGCKPIVQAIGVQSTIYQITGAFVGTEQFNLGSAPGRPASSKTLYRMPGSGAELQYNRKENNAINIAKRFDKEIVQRTKPVTLYIFSDGDYVYTGMIVNFKVYGVRGDRAYYAMDLLSTSY